MMNALGLSAAQIEERRRYVCAGDVAPIMAGEWNTVWREKKGLAQPDDLSDKLAVQMGSYTEPFNLAWYMRETGREVIYYSDNPLMRAIWAELTGHFMSVKKELVVSADYPWMACNLDALSTTSKGKRCVLDAKHVGRLDEQTILRYTPVMVHQAIVCKVDWWALSCFIGNSKWEPVEQEVEPFYAEEVIEKTREFWGYVERNEEPRDRVEATLAPKPEKRLRNIAMPLFDAPEWKTFIAANNWAVDAANTILTFAETEGAAKKHAIAREDLKKLVPDDVGELRRGNFVLTRAKNGAVTMKTEK